MRKNGPLSITALLFCIGLQVSVINKAYAATCLNTPNTADSSRASALSSSAQKGGDYRVQAARWDPILRQRWLTIASCNHPERPPFALLTHEVMDRPSFLRDNQILKEGFHAVSPLVRAGDIVRLWRQEDNVRIEVAAVSEESGGLGNTIRVRLVQAPNPMVQQFIAVIRGPADVELQR